MKKKLPRVTIAIATFNRKKVLEWSAKSLYASNLSCADIRIRIYDDKSSEYDADFLWGLFPTATSIIINSVNKKADLNTYDMYVDFLKTEDDYFFNADSDIIYEKEWLSYAINHIGKTDGILSLFNTKNHLSIGITEDELFEIKKDLGAAGTFFTRQRLQQFIELEDCDSKKHIDWGFSEFYQKKGYKLLAAKKSLVQHIGLIGQNSVMFMTDFGKGFVIDNLVNGQILNDLIEDLLETQKEATENFIEEKLNNSKAYQLGNIILAPIRFILQKTKKN